VDPTSIPHIIELNFNSRYLLHYLLLGLGPTFPLSLKSHDPAMTEVARDMVGLQMQLRHGAGAGLLAL
jgi:hypothetical protein